MRAISRGLVAAVLAVVSGACDAAAAERPLRPYDPRIFPPWQHGANNDAIDRGLDFTVPEVDNMADFHGDVSDPKLVLYVGGNYFFAMAPLVKAFEAAHPTYRGRLFWETLPPGRLVQQMEAGGRTTSGNMTFTARPDVYLAGMKKVEELVAAGKLDRPIVPYVANTLTIMVPKGNPAHVASLADLSKPEIKLAMPNPAFEGIARQIRSSLTKAGGDALATIVYTSKVADGATILTEIHHRQTPLFLMQGRVDAGVTWQSEAVFQEQIGNPIAHVDIPAAVNARGVYAGAMVKDAPHPEAARAWLAFIASPVALRIFEGYGFRAYNGDAD